MNVTRQAQRAQERKTQKEQKKLIKQLQLSDLMYVADDSNMTFSAMGPHLVDFMKVIGLPKFLKDHLHIEKRESLYSPDKLSQLLILQNILGYDRIEGSRPLNQDSIMKQKLEVKNYPDPETFRDELQKYDKLNMEQLFFVNLKVLNVLCRLTEPQYVDLHFDSKVITVYGDQEGAEEGYNPHKPGRKSYHLKVCTIEPFGFILAIQLEPGNSVSSTGFIEFYKNSLAAIPQNHFVVQNVRLDRGFFGEDNIKAFEGDYLFFEVVAKKYSSIKRFIDSIAEEDFEPFYPDETIYGASFSLCLNLWERPRDFVVVRKLVGHEDNGQGMLFPKWHYQVICHNQLDMSPKEVWEDYNQRARIELNIRDLDYDHFITKVPTGIFLSNFAYFWHCVLSYNLVLIFKNFILTGEWSKYRLSTLRKKLITIPGRLVNHSGKMVMRLIADFPYLDILASVKERLIWIYQSLNPLPV
ncbi:MAG: IS1380 family transposase [Deltaproteobacteria bacterium]|nr:IS1380 family transposase [Deltaproteobacteria bacterium]